MKTQIVYVVYFPPGEDMPSLMGCPLEKVEGRCRGWIGLFRHKSHAEMYLKVLRDNQTNQT